MNTAAVRRFWAIDLALWLGLCVVAARLLSTWEDVISSGLPILTREPGVASVPKPLSLSYERLAALMGRSIREMNTRIELNSTSMIRSQLPLKLLGTMLCAVSDRSMAQTLFLGDAIGATESIEITR